MAISYAVDPSNVARVVGIKTSYVDLRESSALFLPQRVAVVGQGNTASTYALKRRQVFTAFEAGQVYGFGSPIHHAVQQLLPVSGDGVGSIPVTVYPLEDHSSGEVAAGTITPSGTVTKSGTYRVMVNGIPSASFAVPEAASMETVVDSIVAAVNAEVNLPVTATDGTTAANLTSKWKGISANDIKLAVEGPTDAGVTFALVQPTGGAQDPDIDDIMATMGETWETLIVNCVGRQAEALNDFSTINEGRWLPTVRRPYVAFYGDTRPVLADVTAITDARGTDRTNVCVPAPDSDSLPFVVAARAVARIASVANVNPPVDYAWQSLTGVDVGEDSKQWGYSQRDTAVKKGCSTTEVKDGVVKLSDIVTTYHPTGDPLPAWRYVVDVVKVMNILYNLDAIFTASEWSGAPLVPDDQPIANPAAKKPKMAVAAVNSLTDSLGLYAIISDPEAAKASTWAAIDPANPKRLNVGVTYSIAGNVGIISVDFNFGFYFGGVS